MVSRIIEISGKAIIIECSGLKRSEQLDAVRDLINTKLPVESYNVLKYLLEFFNLVRRYFHFKPSIPFFIVLDLCLF